MTHYSFNSLLNNFLLNKKIHLVGIYGIGMSALAILLKSKGAIVTGSDHSKSTTGVSEQLNQLGIKVFIGHKPSNVKGADIVIVSSAVNLSNPEYQRATQLNIPVYTRGRVLGDLTACYNSIAVTGSHGKTTTTSLIASFLIEQKIDISAIVGGIVDSWKSNIRLASFATSNTLVLEADESDGSFLYTKPNIAVITNIDNDHLDFYVTHKNLVQSFKDFIKKVPMFGKVIMCLDDQNIRYLLEKFQHPGLITYGVHKSANYKIENISFSKDGSKFDIVIQDGNGTVINSYEKITTRYHGLYNALNIAGAIAAVDGMGVDQDTIRRVLSISNGVNRRFTHVGSYNGAQIIDDYAHHPSEIKEVLLATKNIVANHNKNGKVIAVLQPHRFSRVKSFFLDFAKNISLADHVVLLDIYSAGEQPIPDISAELLFDAILKYGTSNAFFPNSKRDFLAYLRNIIQPNDYVICMGAGDITDLARELPILLSSDK